MARSILDASEEEVNSLARALEQLQKNADRLTNSQKKLLAEFGRMSKTSAGLKEELSLLETYEKLCSKRAPSRPEGL
jgi:chromosome segregation ATPase